MEIIKFLGSELRSFDWDGVPYIILKDMIEGMDCDWRNWKRCLDDEYLETHEIERVDVKEILGGSRCTPQFQDDQHARCLCHPSGQHAGPSYDYTLR